MPCDVVGQGEEVTNVNFRDDQRMPGGHGESVHEGQRVVVFVDDFGGRVFGNDLTKGTGGHDLSHSASDVAEARETLGQPSYSGGVPFEIPDFGRYPVDGLAHKVNDLLVADGTCVLIAPPGTGKTTRLPLLLETEHRIVVTEPRRAAAFAAATRMASLLGESVGQRIGIRMRDDTRVSSATKIEVVTEGVFIRMLRNDVGLTGIGTVVFDEVHERRLDCDLSIAMCLYARELVRPDLRLVAMSATLDTEQTSRLLRAQTISASVPLFDVSFSYEPVLLADIANGAARAVVDLLSATGGDILVFLPGAREIGATGRHLERLLTNSIGSVVVAQLLGSSSPEETDRALRPVPPGVRKVVLATSVAQTSLTIPGVRSVVDSGLSRRASFDAGTGATRLVTERSSRATAIQRAGRAGREAPGHVVRLWSKTEFEQSPDTDVAEILDTDLAEMVLTLARWGVRDPSQLRWIDPPPAALWEPAVRLIGELGLIDSRGLPSVLADSVGDLPAHPRVQAMLAFARQTGDSESRTRAVDLATDLARTSSVRSTFESYMKARSADHTQKKSLSAGLLGAHMFPDRVAGRAGTDPGRYQFGNGAIATLGADDPNRGASYLVAIELDGDSRAGKIFRSEPLTLPEVRSLLPNSSMTRTANLNEFGNVEVFEEHRHGKLVFDRLLVEPTPDDVAFAVLDGVDWEVLSKSEELQLLRTRISVATAAAPGHDWPDWSDANLRSSAVIDASIIPALLALPSKQPLAHFRLAQILLDSLPYDQLQLLDWLAPRTVTLAGGRVLTIDYSADGGPTIRSRLQDFLGSHDGPRIADGTLPLRIELLSPAQRPAATTSDLRGFWQQGYRAVRADLRHRYPKHAWPENPLEIQTAPMGSAGSTAMGKSIPSSGTRRRNG
jgi:ATP-dependent helicase HrpB